MRSRVAVRLLLTLSLVVTAATGCTRSAESAPKQFTGTGPIEITCTVAMLGDIVARVGGDRVAVTNLMGPGTDPHLYRAVPSDRKKLESSDLILYCGHHLEGNLGPTLESMGRRVRTVAICEQVPTARLLADEEHPDAVDPHLWFDVELWSDVAQIVGDELATFDPTHADAYRERTAALRAELSELHAEVKQQVAAIPKERRVMITAHDAFRYFGRAYDVEVLGIQGSSTADEASVRRVSNLVDLIVRRKVSAVFVESTLSENNVKALIEGCRSRGHTLTKGGELYSDAMGAPGTPAGTYVGMIRHNVATLVNALK